MAALTADRNTSRREPDRILLPAAAAKKFYAGAMVCLDGNGNATPGAAATTLRGLGRCEAFVDNSAGIAGALNVDVRMGCFLWNNSAGGDAITEANVGRVCFVVDDNTVALTDGAGTRSRAGVIKDVDATGMVWVAMGTGFEGPQGSAKTYLTIRIDDLVGADAKTFGIPSPVAGTISAIYWDLEGHALATADALIAGNIGGVAITAGAIDIPLASAVGATGVVNPTAANVVAVGSRIDFVVSGTQSNAAAMASLVIEITRS